MKHTQATHNGTSRSPREIKTKFLVTSHACEHIRHERVLCSFIWVMRRANRINLLDSVVWARVINAYEMVSSNGSTNTWTTVVHKQSQNGQTNATGLDIDVRSDKIEMKPISGKAPTHLHKKYTIITYLPFWSYIRCESTEPQKEEKMVHMAMIRTNLGESESERVRVSMYPETT